MLYMETSESTQSTSRETCLGLPLLEERPISEEERAALQRDAKRSLWRGLAWGCLLPTLFLAVVITLCSVAMDSNSPFVQLAPAILLIIITVSWTLFFIFRAIGYHRIYEAAKQDLRKGRIKYYSGSAPETGIFRADKSSIVNGRIAGADISLAQPVTLEVFSGSRRLRRVSGVLVSQFLCLPAEQTAHQPLEAQRELRWVRPVDVGSTDIFNSSSNGRRDLSEFEKEEILHRARTGWRRRVWEAFLLPAHILPAVVGCFFLESHPPLIAILVISLFFIATVWIDIDFIMAVRRARRWTADTKLGFVIITRLSDGIGKGESPHDDKVIEWLPHSKLNWTINGEPAPWRLRG
jgi:threonine/homoserine/homoserine lactone efflux protein